MAVCMVSSAKMVRVSWIGRGWPPLARTGTTPSDRGGREAADAEADADADDDDDDDDDDAADADEDGGGGRRCCRCAHIDATARRAWRELFVALVIFESGVWKRTRVRRRRMKRIRSELEKHSKVIRKKETIMCCVLLYSVMLVCCWKCVATHLRLSPVSLLPRLPHRVCKAVKQTQRFVGGDGLPDRVKTDARQ